MSYIAEFSQLKTEKWADCGLEGSSSSPGKVNRDVSLLRNIQIRSAPTASSLFCDAERVSPEGTKHAL